MMTRESRGLWPKVLVTYEVRVLLLLLFFFFNGGVVELVEEKEMCLCVYLALSSFLLYIYSQRTVKVVLNFKKVNLFY